MSEYPTQAGQRLSRATVLSYAMGYGSGNQFISAIVGTYISVFLTDTFGVPAGAVGFIMVAATIWDAVYSLIVGGLADRTNTRWGRYRPYLIFVPAAPKSGLSAKAARSPC